MKFDNKESGYNIQPDLKIGSGWAMLYPLFLSLTLYYGPKLQYILLYVASTKKRNIQQKKKKKNHYLPFLKLYPSSGRPLTSSLQLRSQTRAGVWTTHLARLEKFPSTSKYWRTKKYWAGAKQWLSELHEYSNIQVIWGVKLCLV